jgi:outer membrane protein assembly factor BamB
MAITLRGRRHVVAFLENALVSVELETGRPLWKHVFSRGYDEHAASPLYEEPLLMVSSPFRSGSQTYRLEIGEPDSADAGPPEVSAKRVWHSRKMSNDVASSVLVDGYVYGFDLRDIQSKAHRPSRGKFTCMELATGDVRWTTDRVGHASLIVADGKLILFNDSGEVLLARASHEGYEELARTQVFGDEICWTAPAGSPWKSRVRNLPSCARRRASMYLSLKSICI